MARKKTLSGLVLALATAPALWGGTVDLTGDWTMEATFVSQAVEGKGQESCSYRGDATANQVDGVLTGSATVVLIEGDDICPPQMGAALDGVVNGTAVIFDLTDPNLGTGAFQGMAILGERGLPGEVVAVDGSLDIIEGPFQGFSGAVTVQRGSPPVIEIPTFGHVAIATMVALLAALGFVLARGRLLSP